MCSGNLNGAASWSPPADPACLMINFCSIVLGANRGTVYATGLYMLTPVVYYLTSRAGNAGHDQGLRDEIIDGVNEKGVAFVFMPGLAAG